MNCLLLTSRMAVKTHELDMGRVYISVEEYLLCMQKIAGSVFDLQLKALFCPMALSGRLELLWYHREKQV